MFFIVKNGIYLFDCLFFSHQKNSTMKISLFDQNYSEIINSMNFILFLFQIDENDENKNLRMNEIN